MDRHACPGRGGRARHPAGRPADAAGPAGPAWRSAAAGVEGADSYTAYGFANPTRRVLAGVLHTRAEVRPLSRLEDGEGADVPGDPEAGGLTAGDLARMPAKHRMAHGLPSPNPAGSGRSEPAPALVRHILAPAWGPHLGYSSDVIEVVETYLYRPMIRPVKMLVRAAKRLQSGPLDAYLAYMLIALIALIAAVTALA